MVDASELLFFLKLLPVLFLVGLAISFGAFFAHRKNLTSRGFWLSCFLFVFAALPFAYAILFSRPLSLSFALIFLSLIVFCVVPTIFGASKLRAQHSYVRVWLVIAQIGLPSLVALRVSTRESRAIQQESLVDRLIETANAQLKLHPFLEVDFVSGAYSEIQDSLTLQRVFKSTFRNFSKDAFDYWIKKESKASQLVASEDNLLGAKIYMALYPDATAQVLNQISDEDRHRSGAELFPVEAALLSSADRRTQKDLLIDKLGVKSWGFTDRFKFLSAVLERLKENPTQGLETFLELANEFGFTPKMLIEVQNSPNAGEFLHFANALAAMGAVKAFRETDQFLKQHTGLGGFDSGTGERLEPFEVADQLITQAVQSSDPQIDDYARLIRLLIEQQPTLTGCSTNKAAKKPISIQIDYRERWAKLLHQVPALQNCFVAVEFDPEDDSNN